MKDDQNMNDGIYGFLYSSGVLPHGTNEDIRKAKKKYWSEYRKRWNKLKRQKCQSFVILFNQTEFKEVKRKADKIHTSPTNYIKKSALSSKLKIDPYMIGEIRELIITHRNKMQSYTDEKMVALEVGEEFLKDVMRLENKIFTLFSKLI